MDAHRCIEEADLCDFNNALIRGFGMLLQGSKFVVAIVANATMFSHLLPGCSCGIVGETAHAFFNCDLHGV